MSQSNNQLDYTIVNNIIIKMDMNYKLLIKAVKLLKLKLMIAPTIIFQFKLMINFMTNKSLKLD